MKNLAVTVSRDSSIQLLESLADVIILDKDVSASITTSYDTVYIRSHFSHAFMMPQNFRHTIESIVQQAKQLNPKVKFIDGMDNVDAIVSFEDKWSQYETFGEFMPRTELYKDGVDISTFVRPIYKKRLSSRGSGVTWDREKVDHSVGDWLIQESLDIAEELRVYIICGGVCEIGAVRRSMTSAQSAQAISSRQLSKIEIGFCSEVLNQARGIDIAGLDIACTSGGELYLMEVNRSPGFAKFNELSGINLATTLYEQVHS